MRRTSRETLNTQVQRPCVIEELGDVSENSFYLFQKDTFHSLCTLQMYIIEKRLDHAADRQLNRRVLEYEYILDGSESIAQSVSENGKWILVEGTYVRPA